MDSCLGLVPAEMYISVINDGVWPELLLYCANSRSCCNEASGQSCSCTVRTVAAAVMRRLARVAPVLCEQSQLL